MLMFKQLPSVNLACEAVISLADGAAALTMVLTGVCYHLCSCVPLRVPDIGVIGTYRHESCVMAVSSVICGN